MSNSHELEEKAEQDPKKTDVKLWEIKEILGEIQRDLNSGLIDISDNLPSSTDIRLQDAKILLPEYIKDNPKFWFELVEDVFKGVMYSNMQRGISIREYYLVISKLDVKTLNKIQPYVQSQCKFSEKYKILKQILCEKNV